MVAGGHDWIVGVDQSTICGGQSRTSSWVGRTSPGDDAGHGRMILLGDVVATTQLMGHSSLVPISCYLTLQGLSLLSTQGSYTRELQHFVYG